MAKPKLTMKKTGNFQRLVKKLSQNPGVSDPSALAAKIGNAKYGKGQMQRKAKKFGG